VIADHLIDHTVEDNEPMNFDLLDEDVLTVKNTNEMKDIWTMYFDEATNVSRNTTRAVIISPEKKQYHISVRLQFECTNNMIEYKACIISLEATLVLKFRKLDVYRDLLLIIFQVKGE
jgi:ribonuclease HI